MKITSILTVALLVATAPGLAGDEVPFKGTGTATWVSTDYVNLTSTFSLGGNATHLGKFTGWSIVSYDPQTFMPVGAQLTVIAANGDRVYLATVAATGTYTVTGGTGRFEGASGSGDWSASGMGTVAIEWDGRISY
jgi:hypothetical protein